jgi:dihydrofolate synthase / folylpolyglutamate synthase
MVVMNYRQTLDYLFAQLPMFHRIGAAAYRADLTNTIALCALLGNPENQFKSIHIAGTNGKGSTSHLIASILQSAGYKTGLYTSPHLKDFRERIRINGKKVPRAWICDFVAKHSLEFEPVKPSFFEYTAVMAFQYYSEEKVDIAVIETGMGGRLDSTNVITPVLSIITNISKDHTAFLGNSLLEIAREKAGIIKKNIPVVIGEAQPEVNAVFIERAGELDAAVHYADQNFQIASSGDSITILPDKIAIKCPLKGLYQRNNFLTAYQAVRVLTKSGFQITEEDIKKGYKDVIRSTGLQGRWQKLKSKPRVICDVAHNEAGFRYILMQLSREKYERLHWVFGLVNDKDATTILEMMPETATYYFCKANIPRGLDVDELKLKAESFGLKGEAYTSVKQAYQAALETAREHDLVFVGGSTFVVAEVL